MTYARFVVSHARLLGFGFAMTFFATFGQTYFIAQFSVELRDLYGLSHTGFGTVYALATLTSAAILVPVGAMIDRIDLRLFSVTIILGLTGAALMMAFAPPVSVLVLYVSILLLRLCGQGLMVHAAITTMARSFERLRGRAISIATIGHPAAEAVMPLATVFVVATLGWRNGWALVAGLLGLVVVPLVLALLVGRPAGEDPSEAGPAPGAPGLRGAERSWTRKEMLGDWRFHILAPTLLAPGFINTAVFFAQTDILAQKGWDRLVFASGFSVYAGATVALAFLSGFLVDRFSAVRLYPAAHALLAAAMVVLGLGTEPWHLIVTLALSGASQGILSACMGALWAELYGTAHLGAIRALTTSMMVLSTALAPAFMGLALDGGLGIGGISLAFAGYAALSAGLAPMIWTRAPA